MRNMIRVSSAALVCAMTVVNAATAAVPGSDDGLTKAVSSIPQRRPGLALLVGGARMPDPVALHETMGYVVHVLDTDARRTEDLRRALAAAHRNGPVAVAQWKGTELPLADHTVNLLVAGDLAGAAPGLQLAELSRVTAPYGHLLVSAGGDTGRVLAAAAQCGLERVALPGAGPGMLCLRKLYPSAMDEWPQFRHDAALTSVSRDMMIGPAVGVRWVQGDLWTGGGKRTVMILSARGRVFYLYAPWRYEAPADSLWNGFHVEARDAFNGQLLWTAPAGDATELERPMAADGDLLYVHRRDNGQVAALDAATGAVVRTYDIKGDIAVHNGLLIVGVKRGRWDVVNPKDGARMRSVISGDTGEPSPTARLFGSSYNNAGILVADSSLYTMVVEKGRKVIRKENFASGAPLWTTPRQNEEYFHSVQGNLLLTFEYRSKSLDTGFVHAYDAAKGAHLWKYAYQRKKAGAGLFVAAFKRGDTVWTYAQVPQDGKGRYVASADQGARDPDDPSRIQTNIGYVALDARTGRHLTNDLGPWKDFGRCGPDLATPRYILGMDFNIYEVAPDGKSMSKVAGNFARGDCGFSYAPANGLRYNSDNNCACDMFIQGMVAVASDSIPDLLARWNAASDRLTRGPAYPFAGVADSRLDWPMYRANAARSSVCLSPVPAKPAVAWRARLPGAVTAPVVGGGKVYVAEPDAHAVHALDQAGGKLLWSYTAGGRVDSPPTYHRGVVLFGARDGTVQAVRADNGRLVWRFMAAPVDRRIMVRGQLESLWPVFGTVLVSDGVAYVIAGRHGDADGGMFLYALDPLSGAEQWRTHIKAYADVRSDPREADIYKSRTSGFQAYTVRNDLMSAGYGTLFFSTMGVNIKSHAQIARVPGRSLITGQGTFLHDNTFPNPGIPGRFDWSVAGRDTGLAWRTLRGGQANPDAELVAFSGDTMYGTRHSQYLHRWKDWNDRREGYLFAASFSRMADTAVEKPPFWAVNHHLFWTAAEKEGNPRFKALSVGKDRIVVASQPGGGLLGGHITDKGEVLVFGKDGTPVSRTSIGAEPLFDGVGIADGKLYVSTQRGEVVCLK